MRCFLRHLSVFLVATVSFSGALLSQTTLASNASLTTQHIDGPVYAIIGEMGNRSAENLGNNANFGFIVGDAGVVLIDSGAGTQAAKAIEAEVGKTTSLPITTVINTGGQDHRWLGNAYFAQKGARIIASSAAVADHDERAGDQIQGLTGATGQNPMQNLEPVTADITFDQTYTLNHAGLEIHISHQGGAHTPGDSWVYIPALKILFTGDIAYGDRMLGVIEVSNSQSWVEVFEAMAQLPAQQVIPGHGAVSTLPKLSEQTYNYLVHLRQGVGEFLDNDGDLVDIRTVDQSAFSHLLNYEGIAPGNALRVYQQMEWE
jgi:glyoxylase-like metal-dependent hydrolase (beta-lactamase superfamily II)